MPLPSTGIVRLSDAVAEFGAGFARLGTLYRVGPGVPTAGKITLADLRGAAASVPATSTPATATIDTAAGPVSNTANFAAQVTDTYGAPLAYALAANASVFTATPALAADTGLASYTVAANRWLKANVAISVAVTNRFARTARANVVWTVRGAPPTASRVTMQAYRDTDSGSALSFDLRTYVSDSSGSAVTYAVSDNPRGTASLSGSLLTVAASIDQAYGYVITVTVYNEYGQNVPLTLEVQADAYLQGTWQNNGINTSVNSFQYFYSQYFYSWYSTGYNSTTNESFTITGGLWWAAGRYWQFRYQSSSDAVLGYLFYSNGFTYIRWSNGTTWVNLG